MASYLASDISENESGENTNACPSTFRELMAIVYGGSPEDIDFVLPNLPDNGADWLDKFSKSPECPTPTGFKSVLVTGTPVAGIAIHHNKVKGVINPAKSQDGSYKEGLFTAMSMALCAMGHKDMRERGATMETKTPEEMVFLMIAADYVGLKIKNRHPEIDRQLAAYKEQLRADDIWKEFTALMHQDRTPESAPPVQKALPPTEDNDHESGTASESGPEEELSTDNTLTSVFNRDIDSKARPYLDTENIDEETYKNVSKAIIQEQKATGAALDKVKKDFNLTGNKMRSIVKAMDTEGLTHMTGKGRMVRYDAEGQPKAP